MALDQGRAVGSRILDFLEDLGRRVPLQPIGPERFRGRSPGKTPGLKPGKGSDSGSFKNVPFILRNPGIKSKPPKAEKERYRKQEQLRKEKDAKRRIEWDVKTQEDLKKQRVWIHNRIYYDFGDTNYSRLRTLVRQMQGLIDKADRPFPMPPGGTADGLDLLSDEAVKAALQRLQQEHKQLLEEYESQKNVRRFFQITGIQWGEMVMKEASDGITIREKRMNQIIDEGAFQIRVTVQNGDLFHDTETAVIGRILDAFKEPQLRARYVEGYSNSTLNKEKTGKLYDIEKRIVLNRMLYKALYQTWTRTKQK